MALQAVQVKNSLESAKSLLSSAVDSVRSGDVEGARASAAEATSLTASAAETTSNPLWSVAAAVPAVGANVDAVKRVTIAVDTLATGALPSVFDLASMIDLNGFSLVGGQADLTPLLGAQSSIDAISEAFASAKVEIDPIDTTKLLPFVAAPLDDVVGIIDTAAPALDVLSDNLPAILDVLGVNGERTYLLIFQNNAESRATGGNPSTSMLVTVNNGQIAMGSQDSSADYLNAGLEGVTFVDLPAETLALYESDFPGYSQNYNRTPEFATTARLFDALISETQGVDVDGVISIDPVVMSYMLGVTGPTYLSDGSEITAENIVSTVLFDAYERFGTDSEGSDAYFADVSSSFFSLLSAGGWDANGMLAALQRGAEEQRVYLWFRNEAAQALSVELGLDGSLTTSNESTTQVGLFLNDAAYSKLEYFMKTSISVQCDTTASTMTTSITIENQVPRSNLNAWTLAWRNDRLGLPTTSFVLDALYFGAPGTSLVSSDPATSDLSGWDRTGTDSGREGVSRTVVVPMGETRTVSYTSTLPDQATSGPLEVRYTPGVSETPIEVGESCVAYFDGE